MTSPDDLSEEELVDRARSGDQTAFTQLVERHRRELFAHCYRMLGSPHDAEDALQDALVAAWRGLKGFEGRSSLRTWLYRITTNVCLRHADRRRRRLLSPDYYLPRTDTQELGEPDPEARWIEPWVDELVGDEEDDPAAAYESQQNVELSFVAALQHLPGSQRSVLLLREVLGFSAIEMAEMLDTTPAAVNSALQRARAGVTQRVPSRSQEDEREALGQDGVRELVDAFITAWEGADIGRLTELLTGDVRFTMPPLPAWFDGREDVGRFLMDRVFATPWRLVPIVANGMPAFACYQDAGDGFRLGALNLLELRDGQISWIASFVDPELVTSFGIPSEIRDQNR